MSNDHIIPKVVLKHFAFKRDGNSYHIRNIKMNKHKSGWTPTRKIFSIQDHNSLELEGIFCKEYENKLETDVYAHIDETLKTLSFDVKGVELLRKHYLIQSLRHDSSKHDYQNDSGDDPYDLIQYELSEGQTREQYWENVIQTIIQSPFDSLLKSKVTAVKENVINQNSFDMVFVKANSEFVINDYAMAKEFTLLSAEEQRKVSEHVYEEVKKRYGVDKYEETKSGGKRTFIFIPLTSKIGLMLIPREIIDSFKIGGVFTDPQSSPFFNACWRKGINMSDYSVNICRRFSPNASIKFDVLELDEELTIALNLITIHQSNNVLALKTPGAVKRSFEAYVNDLWPYSPGVSENHDLRWLLEEWNFDERIV